MTSTYDLSWLDAGRTNNGGPQSYTVSILGPGLQMLGSFTTNGGLFTARSGSVFQLIAGNSYTLSFTGLVAEDRTSFIYGVTLTAVPEPATWGLMLAGFAVVGAVARPRGRLLAV